MMLVSRMCRLLYKCALCGEPCLINYLLYIVLSYYYWLYLSYIDICEVDLRWGS